MSSQTFESVWGEQIPHPSSDMGVPDTIPRKLWGLCFRLAEQMRKGLTLHPPGVYVCKGPHTPV